MDYWRGIDHHSLHSTFYLKKRKENSCDLNRLYKLLLQQTPFFSNGLVWQNENSAHEVRGGAGGTWSQSLPYHRLRSLCSFYIRISQTARVRDKQRYFGLSTTCVGWGVGEKETRTWTSCGIREDSACAWRNESQEELIDSRECAWGCGRSCEWCSECCREIHNKTCRWLCFQACIWVCKWCGRWGSRYSEKCCYWWKELGDGHWRHLCKSLHHPCYCYRSNYLD